MQRLTTDNRQPPTTPIAEDLARIAELLASIDVFLRSRAVPDVLARHLRDIGSDHPGYDAALLIDQISFTAHALRAHRRSAAPSRLGDTGQNGDDL